MSRILRLLLLPALFAHSWLFAQPKPVQPPPMRDVYALTLTNDPPPPLFILNFEGKPVPFGVGVTTRSTANQVPVGAPLALFFEPQGTDELGKPVMKPAMEIPLPAGTKPVTLVFFNTTSGATSYRLIEEDPRHTARTVRIINLGSLDVAFKIEGKPYRLDPGASAFSTITRPDAFIYAYASMNPDGTVYETTDKRLRFLNAEDRLFILFASKMELRETGKGRPPERIWNVRDVRIYDRIPVPEKQLSLRNNRPAG